MLNQENLTSFIPKCSIICLLLLGLSSHGFSHPSLVVLQKSLTGGKCGGVVVENGTIMTLKTCITGRFPIFAKDLTTGESSELVYLSASNKFDAIVLLKSIKPLGKTQTKIGLPLQSGDSFTSFSADENTPVNGKVTQLEKIYERISSKKEGVLGLSILNVNNEIAHFKTNTDLLPGSPVFNGKMELVGLVQNGSKEGSFYIVRKSKVLNESQKTNKVTDRPGLLGMYFFPAIELIKFGNEEKFSFDAGLGMKLVYNDHYSLSVKTTFINKYGAYHFGYSGTFGRSTFDDKPWSWTVEIGQRTYSKSSKYAGNLFNELKLSIGKGWLGFGLVLLDGDTKASGMRLL